MQEQLRQLGATLDVRYGPPIEIFPSLLAEYDIEPVFTNTDYEPYATERDTEIKQLLAETISLSSPIKTRSFLKKERS